MVRALPSYICLGLLCMLDLVRELCARTRIHIPASTESVQSSSNASASPGKPSTPAKLPAKLFKSFFFIHCPKTGTSLLLVLRNYISSCSKYPSTRQGYTCFGELGGGFPKRMTVDRQDHFTYSRDEFNVSAGEASASESCGGAFRNCDKRIFHCQFYACRAMQNKVTMVRDPFKWFSSVLDWQGHYLGVQGVRGWLPFESQMHFVSGVADNVTLAHRILQDEFLWWGLTDYWETSICLFHNELVGGEVQDGELRNSRSSSDSVFDRRYSAQLDALVPNRTEYILRHYSADIEFYFQLNVSFWARARETGCL